jgi:hypothetical protein
MGSAADSVKRQARRFTGNALRVTGAIAPGIFDPITAAQTSAVAGTAANVVDKPTPPPEEAPPEITPPTPMPIPGQDTLEAVTARRRSIQAQLARRGRLSTILSQPQAEPLGGAA